MSNDNYIWVIGENHGSTANNNSYFFWKHIVNIKDGIDKYIVFQKNDNTKKVYNSLSSYEKRFVLWKNSINHFKVYNKADLLFASSTYKDVIPNKFIKEFPVKITTPLIYLRHGVAGMKRTNYTGNSYWNNMFKFLSYNPTEPEDLMEYNHFHKHQILSFDYLPRYTEFVKKDQEYTNKNQILWFITWREYFGSNAETKIFSSYIQQVVKSKKLKKYLNKNNLTLKVCVHQFFDRKTFKDIYKYSEEGVIDFVHSQDIDVMDELVKSEALITDYSSVAYDFSLLNRPVLLFQPDLEVYNELREFMCDVSEFEKYNITEPSELVDVIVNEKFNVNPFFRNNWPENIDYEYIKEGKHIDEMYEYFVHLQKNKVTVLGLNFYEHNNIVNYTMSLVEILLEKGYLVEVISLYRNNRKFKPIYGLNMKSFYWEDTPSIREKLFRKLKYHSNGNLKYNSNNDEFHHSVSFNLNKFMKKIHSKTVISTDESLHLYLDKCSSNHVKNKIYCFHSPVEYKHENYKILLNKINNIDINKSIFMSERDLKFFENKLDFKTPDSKLIIDSYITENQILKPINLNSDLIDDKYKLKDVDVSTLEDEDLLAEYKLLSLININKKESFNGLCLVNFEEYYLNDLNNIIEFGKYLKENNIDNISIDVVGKGEYSVEFMELIAENDLFSYINFFGNNFNMINQIRKHDFILDVSESPNYCYFYLQGVLNYKKVFCLKNEISQEIFTEIPNTFIESYEWLCNQINELYRLSLKDLDDYYWSVKNKHLKEDLSDKFIEYLEK